MGKKHTHIFTSESVTDGHPDKVADQISDAILDACLAQDSESHVACETAVTTNSVILLGEITTNADFNYEDVVRNTIKGIGYTDPNIGFDWKSCKIDNRLHKQSPDIAQGVNEGQGDNLEQGAGDQGLMFGYATKETENLMPFPIDTAHKLARQLRVARINDLPYLRPDGKTQVSVLYKDGKPQEITNIVVASQHTEDIEIEKLREDIKEMVIDPVCGSLIDKDTEIFINGTGRFVMGGPHADAGLTGRKIIVDTYGGHGSHGGGAFSGKDPSKVDRSASYHARNIAKTFVAADLADTIEVQLAYCIGQAQPVSTLVDTFGTGKLNDEQLTKIVKETWDSRPKAIIQSLNLKRPIFRKTAAFGHFGRNDPDFTWEQTPKANELKKYLE